jgi:hypothetical protein
MHVLLVHNGRIPVFKYGGTERVIWDLGRALKQLGHEVTYLVPRGSHCDFANIVHRKYQVMSTSSTFRPCRISMPITTLICHTS